VKRCSACTNWRVEKMSHWELQLPQARRVHLHIPTHHQFARHSHFADAEVGDLSKELRVLDLYISSLEHLSCDVPLSFKQSKHQINVSRRTYARGFRYLYLHWPNKLFQVIHLFITTYPHSVNTCRSTLSLKRKKKRSP